MLMKFTANMVMELDATDDTTLVCDGSGRQIKRRSLRTMAFPFPVSSWDGSPAAGVLKCVLTGSG